MKLKKDPLKVIYIEAQLKDIPDINLNTAELPNELFIAYSIQYKKIAEKIRGTLEKEGKKISGFQQVLGCTKLKIKEPVLLIGSGRFHALNLALQNKEVHIYNNSMNRLEKIEEKEIEKLKLNQKNMINRFLHAKNLGILVSTKPGQRNMALAEELKDRIEKKFKLKKVNIFISDNINLREIENFKVDLWINTACSGLINDNNKIINSEDILEFIHK